MAYGIKLSDQDEVFLSYTFLKQNGVSDKKLSNWSYRKVCHKRQFDGSCFIQYSTIPKLTSAKLPSESDLRALLNEQEQNSKQDYYYNLLKTAYENDFVRFKEEYINEKRLTPEQIPYCAKLRAVWEKVIEHNSGVKGVTYLLFKAFNQLYKDRFKTYESFCTIKTKAKANINSVVIDTRWFREQHSSFDLQIQLWAKALLSDPVNSTARSIWRSLAEICKENKIDTPSYSWVKKFVRKNESNIEIYTSKYGTEKAENNRKPYAKIICAKQAGSQWQIDGWDLPFYYKGFEKLILLAVRDAHSKKIVGYSIGESENTQVILEALQDAVKNTGFISFEIDSDNHSFNKTKESSYFKEALEKLGVTWTVDSNPKRKAIAERYFRHLGELYCKKYPGYIGQGIKTKEKSGRPSQEYIDKFTKAGTWLSKEEIKLIALKAVYDFNNTTLTKLYGITPNEAHEKSEKPHAISVDIFERVRLFTKKANLKVIRGQINLTRSGITYEYQLSAEQYGKLNTKNVIVRYEDFSTIYLFDEKDRAIGSVKQKVGIHGALADQTPEDIKKYNRNKGRLNGIKSQAKKENEKLRDDVQRLSPHAFEALNPLITPKDVLSEAKRIRELKQRAEELGIELEKVETGRKPKNMIPNSLQEREAKYKSAFYIENHKVRMIDRSEEEDEDF